MNTDRKSLPLRETLQFFGGVSVLIFGVAMLVAAVILSIAGITALIDQVL